MRCTGAFRSTPKKKEQRAHCCCFIVCDAVMVVVCGVGVKVSYREPDERTREKGKKISI